jgi:hypothetical protein
MQMFTNIGKTKIIGTTNVHPYSDYWEEIKRSEPIILCKDPLMWIDDEGRVQVEHEDY